MSENTAPFVMAPEPTLQEPLVLEASTHDLIISKEQTDYRLSFCISCEHNGLNEFNVPTCLECGCNLSMLTTLSFKSCPINKWTC
jgi:hypothetical protein